MTTDRHGVTLAMTDYFDSTDAKLKDAGDIIARQKQEIDTHHETIGLMGEELIRKDEIIAQQNREILRLRKGYNSQSLEEEHNIELVKEGKDALRDTIVDEPDEMEGIGNA